MELIDQLRWRYAVKKFDPGQKLDNRQLDTILESLRLSASSFGLQPYRIVVVEDPGLRKSLVEHSMNQDKVLHASHLLVFAIKQEITDRDIEDYIDLIAATRNTDRDSLGGMENILKQFIRRKSPEDYRNWATRQAYIALGNLLTVCAAMEVDACPMEGFIPAEYDRVLTLDSYGLTSKVIAVLGFRAQDDTTADLNKVRMSMDDFIVRM
jgi:nitroreductase